MVAGWWWCVRGSGDSSDEDVGSDAAVATREGRVVVLALAVCRRGTAKDKGSR